VGTRLGRYDVIRTLAKGALTDLLLGRAGGMEGFQRHVAIKRLREEHAADPAVLEMFLNEARLAAALHHHNIVQVLDIGEGGGEPVFAMEYVHGVDLRKLLGLLAKRGEQLPFQHVVSIIASAAAALHHAHEQKGPDGKTLDIVHRQVTPGNILVGFDGNVKIVDFGMAKAAIRRSETGVGVLRGSAPYMAPEQCAGQRVDRRSDVFALGIVLYELSTVRRLFKGSNEFLTMSAVVNAEVPRPSQYRRDVPAELEVIMLKSLARDPLARYQSAGDMAEALDKVARGVGVGASTTQLSNYMKLQFGDIKEPWLQVEQDPEVTDVDFDGAASGLAPPPTEAVKNFAIPKTIDATKSSPISHARARTKGSTRPPPASAVEFSRTVTTAVESPRAITNADPVTDVREEPPTDALPQKQKTNVATPPPPPPGHLDKPRGDMTAIVEPLSVIAARAQTVKPQAPRRTLWWVVAAAVTLAAITAVIVLWPSADVASPVAAAPAAPVHAEPEPDPVVVEEPKGLGATARDYEAAQVAADAGVVEIDARAAAAPVEPAKLAEPPEPAGPEVVADEPPVLVKDKPDPARAVSGSKPAKPAVRPAAKQTKRTPKPTAKRTPPPPKKPAAKKQKPKWNPDDLFLGE
jgi:serine/threonine protein kinase